jgi:HEPN domain-containing protein
MLSLAQLRDIATARLTDAEVLLAAKRFDGAAYLCGYAIEVTLKAQTCQTLGWAEFPEKANEFNKLGLQSFKTHDLDVLLRLSGRESYVKGSLFAEWSAVSQWNPESRYQPAGAVSEQIAVQMVDAVKALSSGL